jgi:hypothetical protein
MTSTVRRCQLVAGLCIAGSFVPHGDLLAQEAGAPGVAAIRLLDAQALQLAIDVGHSGRCFESLPKLRKGSDSPADPFTIAVWTPFSKAACASQDFGTDERPERPLRLAALNAEMIVLRVTPNDKPDVADVVEGAVVKRAGAVIEPIESYLEPFFVRYQDGTERELVDGHFRFSFDAFRPGDDLTIVVTGKARAYEWVIPASELAAPR